MITHISRKVKHFRKQNQFQVACILFLLSLCSLACCQRAHDECTFSQSCRCFKNSYFAKVGGIPTAEMNKLEMNFLSTLEFRLYVAVEEFNMYRLKLENPDKPQLILETRRYKHTGQESWTEQRQDSNNSSSWKLSNLKLPNDSYIITRMTN